MNWFQYLCTCKMHKFEVIFKRTKTQYKRKKRLAQHCGDRLPTNKIENM